MRYVDLAIAALVGTSAITGVLAWSPQGSDRDASVQILEAAIRDELLANVQARGTVWILSASTASLCSEVSSLSNSTFTFGAMVDGEPCAPSAQGVVRANVTLAFFARQIVLQGWSDAQA